MFYSSVVASRPRDEKKEKILLGISRSVRDPWEVEADWLFFLMILSDWRYQSPFHKLEGAQLHRQPKTTKWVTVCPYTRLSAFFFNSDRPLSKKRVNRVSLVYFCKEGFILTDISFEDFFLLFCFFTAKIILKCHNLSHEINLIFFSMTVVQNHFCPIHYFDHVSPRTAFQVCPT